MVTSAWPWGTGDVPVWARRARRTTAAFVIGNSFSLRLVMKVGTVPPVAPEGRGRESLAALQGAVGIPLPPVPDRDGLGNGLARDDDGAPVDRGLRPHELP